MDYKRMNYFNTDIYCLDDLVPNLEKVMKRKKNRPWEDMQSYLQGGIREVKF